MSADYDVIGPWSEVKLEILREYASPYSRIVTSQGFDHLYTDGFADGCSNQGDGIKPVRLHA